MQAVAVGFDQQRVDVLQRDQIGADVEGWPEADPGMRCGDAADRCDMGFIGGSGKQALPVFKPVRVTEKFEQMVNDHHVGSAF